jgi:hypothetical protein
VDRVNSIGDKLMFPVSIEGLIEIPSETEDAVLERLRVAILSAGGKAVRRERNKLLFQGRLFAVSWNPLAFFDQCEVSIVSSKAAYNCSTISQFLLITGMIFLLWLVMLSSNPRIPVAVLVLFPLAAWSFGFVGGYFVRHAMFRNFLIRSARSPSGD